MSRDQTEVVPITLKLNKKILFAAGCVFGSIEECEIRSAAVWKLDTLLADTLLLIGRLFQSDSLPLWAPI